MKYTSTFKLILRLTVAIPFLAVLLIVGIFNGVRTWVQFVRYGGEHLTYGKNDVPMINDIYQELKSKR